MKYLSILFFTIIFIFSKSCTSTKVKPRYLNIISSDSTYPFVKDNNYYLNPDYQPTQEQLFKLIHTDLDLSLNWTNQQILGEATLKVVPYFYDQHQIILDAQNMVIEMIKIVDQNLNYKYDDKKITAELPKVYTQQDTIDIYIKYHTKSHANQTAKPLFEDQGTKGFYFINHQNKFSIWTQGQTTYNSKWFPTFDAPNYQSTQDLRITVDTIYKTLSNGRLVESINKGKLRQDHWVQNKPHAPYLFVLVVGEYEIVKTEFQGIPILYYTEPYYKDKVLEVLKYTPEMMSFTVDLFDYEYPWDKYAQVFVRKFTAGGMENTGTTVLNHLYLQDNVDSIISQQLVIHELVHQWFGNLVTPESWSHAVLNESFASYMEYFWIRHKHGKDLAQIYMWHVWYRYNEFLKTDQDYPLKDDYYTDGNELFEEPTYTKSTLILHYLKNIVGEEAFIEAMKYYLRENAYKRVEVVHLRLAFEHITGKDLNWFFEQWFDRTGIPKLYYGIDFQGKKLTVTINQKGETLYYLPSKIKIWLKNDVQTHDIIIDKNRKSFTFELNEKPKLVLLDPNYVLPAEVDFVKTSQELIYQYHLSDNSRHQFESLFELSSDVTHNYLVLSLFLEILKHDLTLFKLYALETLEKYRGTNQKEVMEHVRPLLKDKSSEIRKAAEKVYEMMQNTQVKDK